MKISRLFIAYTIALLAGTFALNAQNGMVLGSVEYHGDWEMSGIEVYLIDLGTGQIVATTFTDSLGRYAFTGLQSGQYGIEYFTGYPSGGIDVADALQIIHHLNPSGQTTWTDLQEKAADMDGDGQVTHTDAVAIIQYWAKQNGNGPPVSGFTTFSTEGEDWVYTESNDEDTIVIQTDSTQGDTTDIESDGSKKGDVDGSFEPQKKPSSLAYLLPGDQRVAMAGEALSIPFIIHETVRPAALGIKVTYDPAMLDIIDVTCDIPGCEVILAHGILSLSWLSMDGTPTTLHQGTTLLTLNARVRADAPAGNLQFESTAGSLVLENILSPLTTAFILTPSIRITGVDELIGDPYPMPARDVIHLPVYAMEAGTSLDCTLINAAGQIIDTHSRISLTDGDNLVRLDLQGVPTGLYTLNLQLHTPTGTYQLNRQVILSE